MSQQITTTFVNKYNANLEFLSQQMGSRFRTKVETEDCRGSEGARAVNQIGAVNPVKRTERHGDTPLVDTPHDARWVYPEDYEVADLIDKQDVIRTIIEPSSRYARNHAMAMNRAIDDEIVAAFFSETTKTGKTGATTTDWATFVAANTNHLIAAGGLGMTVDKLRNARKALLAAEVDVENDQLFVAISAEQEQDLLTETQVISLDYNDTPVLKDGKITNFMGFTFVHSERLGLSGTERRCPAWAMSGMCLGIWDDIRGEISLRDDKSYATQVYTACTIGATRTEEVKVVEVLAEEA